MDWTKLVIGVLLFLQSYGQDNNITATDNDNKTVNTEVSTNVPDVTEVPKGEVLHIIIKDNENISLNLNNQDKLVLCLNSTNEVTSSEFQNTCYSVEREDNSDDWTLEDITNYSRSCVVYEDHLLAEIKCIVGALGGITGVLVVVMVASMIICIKSEHLRKKLCRNLKKDKNEANTEEKQKLHEDNQTFVNDADTDKEQEEKVPTPPRRPSHTLPDNRSSYIQPNTIRMWQLEEMKQKNEFSGTVAV